MADDVITEEPEEFEEFEESEYSVLNDIVHISDGLDLDNLITAYSSGSFPWPEDDEMPILWFCPDPRGILRYSNLHVSRSLKKSIRKNNFTVSTDTCFDEVIDKCAFQKRAGQPGTWITDNTLTAYKDFHRAGYAHSVEIFKDGELVGGLYGIFVKNVFSGESMFHTYKDTSKVALVVLMTLLDKLGITWIDTQMTTPVIKSLGGGLISRTKYMRMIELNHLFFKTEFPKINTPVSVTELLKQTI